MPQAGQAHYSGMAALLGHSYHQMLSTGAAVNAPALAQLARTAMRGAAGAEAAAGGGGVKEHRRRQRPGAQERRADRRA